MTALTPVVLLAGFCAAMSTVAVGRLLVDDRRQRDPVDIGTALVVVGITVWTALWAALEESWLSRTERGALAVIGLVIGVAGLVVLARHWHRSSGNRTRGEDLEASDDGS